nr:hypothetical protein [bacterium]
GDLFKETDAPNAVRHTNYGRIGGYSLKLPKTKLLTFSKLYYKKIVLDDIVTGKLYQSEDKEKVDDEGKKKKAEEIANTLHSKLSFPNPGEKPITKGSFNQSFEEESVIFDIISKSLNSAFNEYSNTYHNNIGQITTRDESFDNQHKIALDSLEDSLREGIKNHGIVFAEKIITEFNEDITNNIIATFEKFENLNVFTEELKRVSDNIRKKDLISNIKDFFTKEIEKTTLDLKPHISSNPPWGIALREALANDKEVWDEENNTWLKKIGAGKVALKDLSQHSNKVIDNIYSNFEPILLKLYNYSEYLTYLKSRLKIINKLIDLGSILAKNRLNIYNESNNNLQDCLIKSVKQEIAKILKSETSILMGDIVPNTHEHYSQFADSLRIGEHTIDTELQELLNVKDGLIDKMVKEVLTKNYLDEEIDKISNIIFNNPNKLKFSTGDLVRDYTVTSYLKHLTDNDKATFIQNRLSSSGSALGALDWSKIGGTNIEYPVILISGKDLDAGTQGNDDNTQGNHDDTKGNHDDTKGNHDNTKVLEEIKNKIRTLIKPEPKFVDNDDPEILQITRISTNIPLTVYSELQKAKEIYDTIVKGNGREVKYRFHTHKHFIDIDEPMGNSNQIPNEDFATYVNLLVHTGVIHVISQAANNAGDIGKVQELVESTTYDKYDFYEDKLKIGMPKDERKVSWDDLIRYLKNDNVYFTHFTEKLIERFNSIFKISNNRKRVAAIEHLKKYFKDDKFPYIPEMVLRYIINSNKTCSALKSLI